MFLVYVRGVNVYAKNLNTVQTFAVQESNVIDYYQGTVFGSYDSNEEATARFNDVIEAATSDKQVYDFRKEIGYWNVKEEPAKKTATKRAGRKPAAEKSPPEHNEPEPKK